MAIEKNLSSFIDEMEAEWREAESNAQKAKHDRERAESIDWELWGNRAVVTYVQACALSLGCKPLEVPQDLKVPLRRRLDVVINSLRAGTLPAWPHPLDADAEQKTGVNLAEFRAWGESLPTPFTFPEQFPQAKQVVSVVASSSVPRSDTNTGTSAKCWPWGNYETELLRHLAAAAENFWVLYDPDEPSTAPTNKQIVDWLKGQGVSERSAQAIGTILRADGLPTGPRK